MLLRTMLGLMRLTASAVAVCASGYLVLACGSEAADGPMRDSLSRAPAMTGDALEAPGSADASDSSGEAAGTQGEVPARQAACFPLDWCSRISVEGDLERVIAVARSYALDVASDCQTAGLTRSFTEAQRRMWVGYLIEYTYQMAGCPLDEQPVEGGISVFGLANTPIAGVRRVSLGRDDVERLMTFYMARFGATLALTADEHQALADFLWDTAANEIDPRVSNTLSVCPRGSAT